MNCFEARKEFAAFWRRTMPLAARVRLVEHLTTCARCDRAFRVFALSAPVVHLESRPEAATAVPRPPLSLMHPRRLANTRAETFARRVPQQPWRVAAAAVVLLMIGGFSAWSSIQWRGRNFADSLVGNTVEVEPVDYSFDNNAAAIDATEHEPALFGSIASEAAAPSENGLAE